MAAAALLAAMLALALAALRDEWRVHRAERDLTTDTGRRAPTTPVPTAAAIAEAPPRAALLEALAQIRAAARTPDAAARAAHFAAAHRLLAIALSARPAWGYARVVQCYLAFAELGGDAPATRAALVRSYAEGAYLREAAPWRVAYGLAQWQRLDADTRQHVVDEAAWYSQFRGPAYHRMMDMMVGTPAEVAFLRARARITRPAADGLD